MAQPRLHVASLLAFTLSLAGCAGLQTTEIPLSQGANGAPVNFFESEQGSVTIRIVDQRPYAVQYLGDADSAYNALLFRLTNTSKLKAPMLKSVAKSGSTYNLVFDKLPSDSQARYSLVVGLFRNVSTVTDSQDAAFSVLDNKVGEGKSANFTLAPGESKSLTIVINAVGQLYFDSATYVIDSTMPTFLSAASGIVMSANGVTKTRNPEADVLRAYFVNAQGQTVSESTASIPLHSSATVSLEVPSVTTAAENYTVFAELASGSTVLSRRSREVTVEPPASVGVDPRDGEF